MSTPTAGVGSQSPRRPDPGALLARDPEHEEGMPADDELDRLVDQILGSKPRPVDWSLLTGEAAAEQWVALEAWVRWVVGRYAIDVREIPACWAGHGDLVEELSALHTAHRAAFDPAGPPTGPADWHATLANTRARLHLAVSRTGCRAGQHRDPAIPEWATESSTD